MSEEQTNASVMSDSDADTPAEQASSLTATASSAASSGQATSSDQASSDQASSDQASSDQASSLTAASLTAANNATPAQALPPQPLAAVEKMEVEVDFEVGRVTLPVSSLANIAQGAVIDIGAVALDSVTAKSGGVAFAHGEFVELGGRVGFRITRLFGERDKL